MVEVGGVETAYSLVNSKPCTVWCPYRCPSAQIISPEFACGPPLQQQQKVPKSMDEHIRDELDY